MIESIQTNEQLTNARMNYNQALRQLENLEDSLEDDYHIKAKVSGEIVQKNSKKGDSLDATNGAVIMAIIQDTSSLTFSMSIDELDITYIKVGQTVSVTADALEGVVYKGTVTTKSTVGTAGNGVTTYPVEVTLSGVDIEKAERAVFGNEDYKRHLIPGMNVTGDIVVDSRENVLTIPVSAVQRGGVVVAKRESVSIKKENNKPDFGIPDNLSGKMPDRVTDSLNVPEGFEVIMVETGLADDNSIEIISGLSEGDVVVMTAGIPTPNNSI